MVRPLLNKDGLDTTGLLIIFAFVSKLIYFTVAKQLHHYLFTNDLFSESQSPYRPNQSLETALQRVTNDILLNIKNQHVTLLLLLDVSAAFDTADHDTLLQRPQFSCCIQGKVLSWFTSYLSGRSKRY